MTYARISFPAASTIGVNETRVEDLLGRAANLISHVPLRLHNVTRRFQGTGGASRTRAASMIAPSFLASPCVLAPAFRQVLGGDGQLCSPYTRTSTEFNVRLVAHVRIARETSLEAEQPAIGIGCLTAMTR